MKRFRLVSAMLALALVVGLAFVSCGGDDGTDNGGGNPFVGTWNGTDNYGDPTRLIFTDSTWTMSWPGNTQGWPSESGTYTYSGNTATLAISSGFDGATTGTARVSGNSVTVTIGSYTVTLTK